MAYSFTVTSETSHIKGRRHLRVLIEETDVAADSEGSTLDSDANGTVNGGVDVDVPQSGIITLREVEKVSGDATTLAPRLGKAAGWTDDTLDDIGDIAAAASHKNTTALPYSFEPGVRPVLHFNAKPDTGTNNVVRWLITIVEGHQL